MARQPSLSPWSLGLHDDESEAALQFARLEPRSTAPFQLATELPAAVLARTLGITVAVAVAFKWQRAAAGEASALRLYRVWSSPR